MVRHVMVFKFKDTEEKTAMEHAKDLKAGLEALVGVIPGLISMQVGLDETGSERAYTCSIFSEFESFEALAAFKAHPGHIEAIEPLRKASVTGGGVDYTV